MARTADAVVIEVEARLNQSQTRAAEAQFDTSVNRMVASAGKAEAAIVQSSKKTELSLETTGGAVTKLTAQQYRLLQGIGEFARAFQIPEMSQYQKDAIRAANSSQLLGTQIGNIGARMASGSNPFTAIAQGGIQVASAMRLSSMGMATVGGVLGGVFVTATLAAVGALTELIIKQFKHGESLDDLAEKIREKTKQTRLGEDADALFGRTLEGVTEALRKNRDAIEAVEDAHRSLTRRQFEAALVSAGNLKIIRDETAANLAKAKSILAVENANAFGIDQAIEYERRIAERVAVIDALEKSLEDTDKQIAEANAQIRETRAKFVAEVVTKNIEGGEEGRVKRDFQKKVDAEIELVKATKLVGAALDAEIAKRTQILRLQEQSELEAIREANRKKAKEPGPSGRQLSFQEARSIAEGAGLQVNSAQRPTWIRDETAGGGSSQERLFKAWVAAGRPSDNPVAPPGTSAHEGARGRWALDIQLAPGLTPGKIKKLYAAEGTSVDVFPERGHLHVSGSRSDAADSAMERERREAAAQLQKENQQTAAFNREMRGLEADLIAATHGRVESAEAQLQITERAVVTAMNNDIAGYKEAEATGRLAVGAAELLAIKRREVATAEIMALYNEEGLRKAAANRQLTIDAQDAKIDQLQYEADNTKTTKARRDALLRVLEAEQQRERLVLNDIILEEEIGSTKRLLAEAALARLNAETGRKAATIIRDHKTPGEQFASDLNDTGERINEELESVAVDGLQRLNDGLTDAIMGTKSLAEAFRAMAEDIISQLIRIAIQQLIIKPMANLLFGGGLGGGGGGGGGTTPSIFGDLPGFLIPEGFASGGSVTGGKPILVGEEGPELFVPSGPGTIVPNNAMATLGGQAGGGQSEVIVKIVSGEMFDAHVARVSGPIAARVVALTAPAVSDMGMAKTVNRLGRPHF